ncbi:retrotransposon protein, putative, ty1-copia subclass [Tanacetum coccineum]
MKAPLDLNFSHIKKPRGAKGTDKGKTKLAYAPKPKIPPSPTRDNPAKDSVCHHCHEVGHWRRNCPSYHAELKKRKNASIASISGSKKLKHGALSLYVGNGMRATVEAIGSFDLILPRYPKKTMGYYFYYPLENKIFVARNAEFFENNLMVQEVSGIHGLLEAVGVEPQNVKIPIRRSAKIHQVLDRYGFYDNVKEYELGDLHEPPNYKATLSDLESDKWLDAMNTEMQSMKDNQVWVSVDLPPNGQTVRSKWLFKKKTDMDGNVHTFKACLVAKGYTQTYDVDYGETLSPVGDIRAISILLAITAFYDYEIWQMDFLFKWSPKRGPSGSNVAFLDLGEAAYILGIKIIRDRSKQLIALSQSAYLEKILKKFRMENSMKGYTPMVEKPNYRKSQCAQTPNEVQRMQRVPYASAIGYVFVLNGGAMDWKSAKQSTTVMSSIEAEYIAAAEASMEAFWMRKFIDGLGGVVTSNKRPMEMMCDNEPAIAIANDPEILKGARHFQRKYHYIREVIQECEIVLKKVHTDDNVAVPFTKPMPYNKHYEHAMEIGICHASSLM